MFGPISLLRVLRDIVCEGVNFQFRFSVWIINFNLNFIIILFIFGYKLFAISWARLPPAVLPSPSVT